jgi:hypothetical protein
MVSGAASPEVQLGSQLNLPRAVRLSGGRPKRRTGDRAVCWPEARRVERVEGVGAHLQAQPAADVHVLSTT